MRKSGLFRFLPVLGILLTACGAVDRGPAAISELQLFDRRIEHIVIHPDGSRVLVSHGWSGRGETVMIDLDRNAPIFRFDTGTSYRPSFSADGSVFLVNRSGGRLRESDTGIPIGEPVGGSREGTLTPDGTMLIATSYGGIDVPSPRVWDTETGRVVRDIDMPAPGETHVRGAHPRPSVPGTYILATNVGSGENRQGRLSVLDLVNNDYSRHYDIEARPVSSHMVADSTTILISDSSNSPWLYSTINAQLIHRLEPTERIHTRARLSPDGRHAYSVHDRMLFRWNTQTAALIGQVELPRERFENITSFDVHPSNQQIITGHFDGVMRVWDIETLFGPTGAD